MRLYFFFNDTATTEIYTLSLHDALPICTATTPTSLATWPTSTTRLERGGRRESTAPSCSAPEARRGPWWQGDRKSTRLNSSHANNSYAVFCLKKKNLIRLARM